MKYQAVVVADRENMSKRMAVSTIKSTFSNRVFLQASTKSISQLVESQEPQDFSPLCPDPKYSTALKIYFRQIKMLAHFLSFLKM